MSSRDEGQRSQNRIASIGLENHPLRTPVERIVSEHIGREWTIKKARDMGEYACHPAAIFSDGSYSVFAKFSEAADGWEQFEIELAGLRLLAERSGVLIPAPIGIRRVPGGSILVLEAVRAVARTPRHWRQIGQALACIHKIKGERFGLDTNGYFGPLRQDNTPLDDWPTFYAERRLEPGLRLAVDSGNLPPNLVPQIDDLIWRLPELCGPEVQPSLLHGDAQQNNFISTEMGTVVIDPAVYFGNPEVDLACIDIFQTVPEDVFEGYQDELSIDAGFWERRDLWRVWGYLAAVAVEGSAYLGKLTRAVQRYL
jgi:protein-ribulosamine 3-kinase